MRFQGAQRERQESDSMNLTPMIDVIFILLIFFMISTQFKQNSLPLDLPQASSQEGSDETSLLLSVDSDLQIELEGVSLSLDSLLSELEDHKQGNPELALTLACDKSVPFEQVVLILDILGQAGIEEIGIQHEAISS